MNAAFGVRFVFDLVLARDFVAFFLADPRLAVFLFDEDDFFLAELFFFVAIASPEWDDGADLRLDQQPAEGESKSQERGRNRETPGKLYREDSSFIIRTS
jgi:hypothetical protein